MTGMVGYFLAKNKLSNASRWLILLPLGLAALLHGLYDFGLASGVSWLVLASIFITISASVGLFLLYMRATDLDQESGLSAVGHNTFCRSCGQPNPKHNLYCTRCGQYA
jgi:RsiW-degrading membrane proteinase PrsW (M82 family)